MRIIKLRASFGKLHSELALKEGFDPLYLPNEAGKSTWSAFVVAMLYGIDTSERANTANQGLPMKERYKPWDGRAMEGSMELQWQGRHITIERSTSGRVPMGVFRAYETESGIPVTELTGENCGRVLCGVERTVFERTAFIRQLGLAVTQDAALEKRLGALVSTGEEGGKTYLELEKELRNRRNKLIGRAGRIPQLAAEKEALEGDLKELYHLQDEAMELTAQKEAASDEAEKAQALLDRIQKARDAQKRAGLLELEARIFEQEALCRRLEDTAAGLPCEEALHDLQRKLESKESALQTAKMDAAFGISEVEKPPVMQGFSGLSAEEALSQTEKDKREIDRLSEAVPQKRPLPLIGCLLLLGLGIGLCFFRLYFGIGLAAVGLVGLILVLILQSKSKSNAKDASHQAQLILLSYGIKDPTELLPLGRKYADCVGEYEEKCRENEQQKVALLSALQQAQAELEGIVRQVQTFAPNCATASACREAISAALHAHEQLLTQKRALDTLRQQHRSLLLVLGSAEQGQADPEALHLDEAKIAYDQRSAAHKLSLLTSRLDQIRGAISAMGDPVVMEAELEQLRERLAKDSELLESIDIALAALKSADETLRSRFSPQITAEAGQILAILTDQKYPKLLLEPDLRLSVREEGGTVMRSAAAMSCGTADQMYLALRLAMCHQLLPENAPLILDDALVNFDEERARSALRLLEKEAEKRQVILFTCRKFA